ncbi:hypothetical protein MXD63_29655 [Frankia sp. Cpl3]|nr:hypothetical protein [Frankia sp. Cpl3]
MPRSDPGHRPLHVLAALAVTVWGQTRKRLQSWEERSREEGRDGGYSTETVIVTALLVVLALTVIAIIGQAVLDKANSIDL